MKKQHSNADESIQKMQTEIAKLHQLLDNDLFTRKEYEETTQRLRFFLDELTKKIEAGNISTALHEVEGKIMGFLLDLLKVRAERSNQNKDQAQA